MAKDRSVYSVGDITPISESSLRQLQYVARTNDSNDKAVTACSKACSKACIAQSLLAQKLAFTPSLLAPSSEH